MIMLKNVTKNTVIAENELIAESFWDRAMGLLYRKFIPGKMDCMIFERCSSVHSFFMKYKFDAFFVDKSKKVIKLYKDAQPWKIFSANVGIFADCTAIECPSGTIERTDTAIGDIVEWNNDKTEKLK